jgi:CMP-N,N'-diacetyllegionaminic acid synthase
MIDGKRVLALVPARAGSKGLPGKNVRPLAGKPLLAWPIAAALAAECVDRVVLSTDSADYGEIGRRFGADVPFLRPAAHAADTAPSIDYILHALETLAGEGDVYEYLVVLEPTSPLTEGRDIDAAVARLHAARGRADAIVGVAPLVATHPAFTVRQGPDGLIAPLTGGDFGALPRRQDIEPLFLLDGSLYVSAVEALGRERAFCHARTLGFETARHKALEVDDLVDFLCVEAILTNIELVRTAEAAGQAAESE